MKPTYWFALLLAPSLLSLAYAKTFDIADGDTDALIAALCEAHEQERARTVIVLAEGGYFEPGDSLRWSGCLLGGRAGVIPIPPGAAVVRRDVTIMGRGATLDLGEGHGFLVEPGGHLILDSVQLVNGLNDPALYNAGISRLVRVSVLRNRPRLQPPEWQAPIHNRGELDLRSTVVAQNRLIGTIPDLVTEVTPFEICDLRASAGILNEGLLRMNNVTLAENFYEFIGQTPGSVPGTCASRDLVNAPGASAAIGNSILTSATFDVNCGGSIESLGFNSAPGSASCGFTAVGDRVDGHDYVPHDARRQNGRIWLAASPGRRAPGSPAAPGTEGACEALDVRGYVRPPGGCERGAIDHRATPDLNNALDGLWFDVHNDGQYLQVGHFGTERVLLTWLSYDVLGDQVWVYGVGTPEGGTLEATAFRNDGVRVDDGQIQGALAASEWGSLSLTVRSCRRMDLEVVDATGAPAEYTLSRLTEATAADCFDDVPFVHP